MPRKNVATGKVSADSGRLRSADFPGASEMLTAQPLPDFGVVSE